MLTAAALVRKHATAAILSESKAKLLKKSHFSAIRQPKNTLFQKNEVHTLKILCIFLCNLKIMCNFAKVF